MPPNQAAKLYTPDLLSLATELAQYSLSGNWDLLTEVRSRTCGGMLRMGIDLDSGDAIGRLGLSVSACAVGQAAAAIFARSAAGLNLEAATVSLNAIERWLQEKADLPDWPGIQALSPAREHTGRHGAIVLPWKASVQALSKERDTR